MPRSKLLLWDQLLIIAMLGFTTALEYADPCASTSDKCNPESELHCDGKSCTCTWGTFYDRDRKHCVVPIGGFCKNHHFQGSVSDRERACPNNANCVSNFHWHNSLIPETVVEGLIHSNMMPAEGHFKCSCDKGYAPDHHKRTCVSVLGHGASCKDKKEKCDESLGLTCGTTGKCGCKDETSKFYDTSLQTCAIKVGDKCSTNRLLLNNGNEPCEQNSICSSLMEVIHRYREMMAKRHWLHTGWMVRAERCVCAPGFTLNSKNKCARSFHVDCSEDKPCNSDRFLACINGACQCESGTTEVFEEDKNASCHILPGAPCSDKNGPKCVDNAVCKDGKCLCLDGFSEDSDKCFLTKGKSCVGGSAEELCNHYRGLACISSKCSCFDFTLKWNEKLKTCVAGEGKRCGKINFSESEVDILHREDPFYPLETLPTARAYFEVACEPGSKCTSSDPNETHNRKHCKM